ncbi:Ribosomal protein L24e, conserved site-containing protein [Artemisia annua]|uniref:Ribosomal protein L24e, conserved site-containing protein n=1 Tax=Artemisia annua TaxID=35608 RepID=A0A2U1NWS5_ARTAN|nr:Ribosomal protein L24e, conserved site-containing protein [Artemisia annua]
MKKWRMKSKKRKKGNQDRKVHGFINDTWFDISYGHSRECCSFYKEWHIGRWKEKTCGSQTDYNNKLAQLRAGKSSNPISMRLQWGILHQLSCSSSAASISVLSGFTVNDLLGLVRGCKICFKSCASLASTCPGLFRLRGKVAKERKEAKKEREQQIHMVVAPGAMAKDPSATTAKASLKVKVQREFDDNRMEE